MQPVLDGGKQDDFTEKGTCVLGFGTRPESHQIVEREETECDPQ